MKVIIWKDRAFEVENLENTIIEDRGESNQESEIELMKNL